MYLHESEQESSSSIPNRLFTITQPINNRRNKRVEMKLKMIAGENNGGSQSLKRTLRNAKTTILQEIQTTIDERWNFGGT